MFEIFHIKCFRLVAAVNSASGRKWIQIYKYCQKITIFVRQRAFRCRFNRINTLIMRILKLIVCLVLLLSGISMPAQDSSPVSFTVRQEQISEKEIQVIFEAEIAAGWHVYSTDMPDGGPISASVTVESAKGASADGKLQFAGEEVTAYDSMFGMEVRYFEKKVTFIQKFRIKGRRCAVKGFLEYAACNDMMCIPPATVEFSVKL